MILTVKTKDTVLTSKGTTSIPVAIRQAAGLFPGSRIARDFEGGEIRARRRGQLMRLSYRALQMIGLMIGLAICSTGKYKRIG